MKKRIFVSLVLFSMLSYQAESSESLDSIQERRLPVGVSSSASFSFQDLGADIQDLKISGNGLVIMGNRSSRICLMTSEGQAFLDPDDSSAYGMNYDGTIIVGKKNSQACIWVKGVSGYSSTLLHDHSSQAQGVSDDGSTIVGKIFCLDSFMAKPCRWQRNADGRYQQILPDVGAHAVAWFNGIDSKASMAVGTIQPKGNDDWNFQQPYFQTLGTDGSSGEVSILNKKDSACGQAIAVSADGKVIIGKSQYGIIDIPVNDGRKRFPLCQACYWTENGVGPKLLGFSGGWQFINLFLYFQSQALACNGDGTVIVGSTSSEQHGDYFDMDLDAFIWTQQSGIRSISQLLAEHGVSLKGWTLTKAIGISRDGKTIVGIGEFEDTVRTWKVTIPTVTPAPSLIQWVGSFVGKIARRLLPVPVAH